MCSNPAGMHKRLLYELVIKKKRKERKKKIFRPSPAMKPSGEGEKRRRRHRMSLFSDSELLYNTITKKDAVGGGMEEGEEEKEETADR